MNRLRLACGLIPAMTVGIATGFCAAVPADGRPVEHAAAAEPARIICRMRADSGPVVRATIEQLGLGGQNIALAGSDCEHPALAATLASFNATHADSRLNWARLRPCNAEASKLAQYIVIEAPPQTPMAEFVAALSAHTELFEVVEADAPGFVLGTANPNDPLFANQYGLHNTGASIGGNPGVPHADISAINAWQIAGGVGVTIAVLDTGVSHSHPDLAQKLVPGRSFVGADPNATDDSPYVPHGTACAGIAAASANDGYGISGVSWNARIMPVRVADQWGNSSESACASGIIWAVDHGARVISISLAYSGGTEYLRAAVTYASASGAVIVAATGNTPGIPVYFPARLPEVLAVTATDNRDFAAPFCTTGPEVDVSAPGVMIMTTTDSNSNPNGHRFESGTSMAAPFVSGIAALLLETAPWLSSSEVRRIIKETADDRGPAGWDPQFGHGRVNAHRALESLSGEDEVCVADWNGDGLVTSTDFFDFLTSFFAGRGDVNGDGQTNTADLFEFMTRYIAGC